VQKSFDLNIDWYDANQILRLVPGLQPEGLRGGTYSPEDGSASPLKACAAFYAHAKSHGAEFHFNEKVIQISLDCGCINRVITNVDPILANFSLMPLDRGQAKSQLYLMYHCQSNQKLMKPPSPEPVQPMSSAMVSIAT